MSTISTGGGTGGIGGGSGGGSGSSDGFAGTKTVRYNQYLFWHRRRD